MNSAISEHDSELLERYSEAFVREWIMSGEAFKAATILFPNDNGLACRISLDWPKLQNIVDLRAEYLALDGPGLANLLPTKSEYAKKILSSAETATSEYFKHKYFRLFGEIMGYIEKPAVTNNTQINNTQISNRVMYVKDHGDDDEWERRVASQQRTLQASA